MVDTKDTFDPSSPSSVYAAMIAGWQLIRDIRGGAAVIRERAQTYLPQFSDEDADEYRKRVAIASFTAIYEDATRTLVAKPFSKEVVLQGTIPAEIDAWKENVDLAGNNLHVYASNTFGEALHMGACFIFVDMPRPGTAPANLAQERAMGLRPYLRNIHVDDMFAIYDGMRAGKTYIRQIRFRDNSLELDDLEEKLVERVRVIDDYGQGEGELSGIVQRVYQKGEKGWEINADLSGPIVSKTITEIPLVPLIFGLQVNGRFGIKPTMGDLAYKQIEHYQHSNRLDNALEFTGFSPLQAKGMAPPYELDGEGNKVPVKLRVGQKSILFAPPAQAGDNPSWEWLKTDAAGIQQLREHKKDLEQEMRTLGLQPTMPTQGIQNMAATTSAINSARTHSAVQAWAIKLKDALELAFVFMARWVGLPETTEVFVHTDFSSEVLGDADEKMLLEMVTLGLISRETFYDEMLRRDVLGPQFDKVTEAERMEIELASGIGPSFNIEEEGGTEGETASGGSSA